MHIENTHFVFNTKGEIVASDRIKVGLVNRGFATKFITYSVGGEERISYRLNPQGIKACKLGLSRIEDVPKTPLYEEVLKLMEQIATS